jgi:hypothetical protein
MISPSLARRFSVSKNKKGQCVNCVRIHLGWAVRRIFSPGPGGQ